MVTSGRPSDYSGGEEDYYMNFKKLVTPSRHYTFIFNMFVMIQLANFLNCRKLLDEVNIFEGNYPYLGILKSHIFMGICVFIFFLQAILVTHGGLALSCYKVDGYSNDGGIFFLIRFNSHLMVNLYSNCIHFLDC